MAGKRVAALAVGMAALGAGSVVVAHGGFRIDTESGASVRCPGGMARLSHVLDEDASIFPGDPETEIEIVATIEADGYLVERITTGVHTGTHLDAPGHFIAGGRTVDDLLATDLVWPTYVVDVRGRLARSTRDDFQLTIGDLKRYEAKHGRIPDGAMVILRTGFEDRFGTDGYFADAPGFSGDAVQWMVDRRDIGGLGSDTLGPDATSDADFLATYTILANDRVAIPDLAGLDALDTSGDIMMAGVVKLRDGSAYQVDPLACLGA